MRFEPVSEPQTMRLIESAMRQPVRAPEFSQTITGARERDKNMPCAWSHDRRFQSTQKSHYASGDGKRHGAASAQPSGSPKDDVVKATSYNEALGYVQDALQRKLADMLALPLDQIDASLSLAMYGVDSLVAAEVRNWLGVAASTNVSIFDILQSSSLAGLAKTVAEKRQLVGARGFSWTDSTEVASHLRNVKIDYRRPSKDVRPVLQSLHSCLYGAHAKSKKGMPAHKDYQSAPQGSGFVVCR